MLKIFTCLKGQRMENRIKRREMEMIPVSVAVAKAVAVAGEKV